ncbi:hypothetical protein GCM10027217_18170 [Pseudomaricurvus hydrocarbonicus]
MANNEGKVFTAPDPSTGEIGVYLKRHECGAMIPCNRDGQHFGNVCSVNYEAATDQMQYVTVKFAICGILSDSEG